ncbi:hypothetical protein [Sneathiella aquimaris]|uniref:hypothetical protein n=1 Tax=Sneathiella aquimaris TaxID=2599305 RepID=UPI00146B6577|nr:hypothetical protein [Sneathiella aquimaris]
MNRYIRPLFFGYLAIANLNLAMAASLQSEIAAYTAEDCAPVVQQHMTEVGIDPKHVEKIDYLTIHKNPGDNAGEDYEFQSWINFSSCQGNYVIMLDRSCFIQQSYFYGRCTPKQTMKQ